MKKYCLILLSAFILLFTACDSWMQQDDFYSDIENDVKVANATQISVYVRYAMTRQGKTDPEGPATFKVEIPHNISATTEPEYGFVRWAAFSTDFLATGDNQSKNKDVYFVDDEDYNTRLLPHEIKSPVVVFEDPKSPSTSVVINEARNDLFLVPIVAQRPTVSLTIPAKGSSGVVRNMSVRINFSKPMDPESFKNEEGIFDKIQVTQGIQSFTADGDIEINSEDITDRFSEPVFSKNKRMVTLKFKPEEISEGYSSQSSVNITVSKDVKDLYGFTMTDDDKISFTVGSSMDTLAPRITRLSAGTALTNFDSFKGMYKDAATWNLISGVTQMESWQQGSGTTATYLGASSAPVDNIDSSFFDKFAPPQSSTEPGYRMTGKLYIHTFAEDIAGSGSNQSQTGIETDVAMLGVRATLMYAADGSVPESPVTLPTSSVSYMPQSVGPTIKDVVYKNLVHAINVKNGATSVSDPGYIPEDKGFLFEYDLSSLPDGLIRVDVFAVDMVQNSGLSTGGELSEEYGNGYASLFVVKDTTPPDAAANSSYVKVDTSASTLITADNYFNEKTYANLKIKSDDSSITDSGHPRLRAHHDNMKWIVKPTKETDWVGTVKTTDTAWGSITSNYGPFPIPGNEGEVYYTYALMDDVGNISNAVGIAPIYYDSVAPVVQTPYLVADEGYTAGVARDNVLDEQTLVVPVTEITSGLKSIELKVRKNGATEDYATPLAADSLAVVAKDADGNTVPYTVDSGKKIITFSQPITNFDSNVTIKGLKLSDNLNEQGSFEINVLVKDAAAADSVHETTPAEGAVSNTDSVPVQIKTVYIPNIRKTERLGVANSAEYWIDYNASTLTKKAGSNPLTDVYITFQEATSGAKIFDFTGSSITLTDDTNGTGSKIYKINAATGTIDGIAIPSTISGNKLIITSSVDAKNNFANPDGDNKITVKITNVALADEGAASNVNLKIYDTATNTSAAGTTICSNEGSLNLATPGISTPNFKFDSTNPTSAMTHGNLIDRDSTSVASTATEAIGKTAAETGYTNEDFINATVTLNPKASGISSVRIDGDAEFVSGTTTIKANGTDVSFDISSEGKVVTFKNANGHLALGSGTTAVTLTITNLKLTSGDGTKNVKFLARSFGNVEDTTGSSDSIVLDTVPPVWVDNGLYAAAHNNVSSEGVYPHSISDGKAYGLAGIDSTNPADLYFYRRYNICIKPDVSDDNLKDAAALIDYTHDGVAVNNNNAAYAPGYALNGDGYTNQTGDFTATAKDKAGNKSTVKTFHIVQNAPFVTDENTALDNYVVLYKPAGSFIHRNTSSVEGTINYVIKGDSQYQIRIKLGGVAAEAGEETLLGSNPVIPSEKYARTSNTTDKPKIDKFYISTNTSYDDSPIASPTNSTYWQPYVAGTYSFADLPSDSQNPTYVVVDNDGTIIINLPHSNCDPIVLHLMDGCGNTTSRRIRPASMVSTSNAIFWEVDSRLGASDPYVGTPDYSYPSDVYTSTDVTFYNNTATLTLSECSDSCRFDDSGVSSPSDLTNGRYTMKSRILVWPANATREPVITDFYDDAQIVSDWYGAKEARPTGPSTAFSLTNNFPQPVSTTPYKLYYIIQDTVGNNRIEKITKEEKDLWLFDNTKPEITNVQTASNINTINGKNYYSNLSSVTYTVRDTHSGIKNDGRHSDFTYSGFVNRKTSQSITYELNGISPSSEEKLIVSSEAVKDWAGNSLDDDVELSYGGTDKWVRQYTAPAWYSGTYLSVSNAVDADWGLSTTTDTTDSSYIAYNITSKAYNSEVKVTFKVNDTDLLGWIIIDDDPENEKYPLTATQIAAFCSQNDSRLTTLSHEDSSNYYTYTYTKYYNNGFADRYTAWHSKYKKAKYFYPVNKAGLICSKPVKVKFEENLIPALKDDDVHYDTYVAPTTSVPFPTTGKITTDGTGDDAVNYTKTGAAIKFSTVNAPVSCWIIYGAGTDNEFGTDDDAHVEFTLSDCQNTDDDKSTYKYKIPLDYHYNSSKTIRDLPAETALKIRLSTTSEDSIVTDLVGPAENNKWTFDETAPAVKFTTSDVKTGVSSGTDTVAAKSVLFEASLNNDSTLYIQSETAKINLSITASESSTSAPTDIAHYQWKVGDAAWTDIPAANIDSNTESTSFGKITFTAPAEKTLYQFRVIDKAGNISEAHEFTTTSGTKINEVTLQRDEWAPEGEFSYTTNKADTSIDLKSNSVGLDVDYTYVNAEGNTVTDPEIRDIKYSSDSSSDYYINKIILDLSAITELNDKHGSYSRSGIKEYQLIENEVTPITISATTPVTISATATSYEIALHNEASTVGKTYEYELKVIDNLNQSRTLKKFRTQADNQAPALTVPDEHWIQAKDGNNASDAKLYDGIYYLRNDKAVITFTINDNTATYKYIESETELTEDDLKTATWSIDSEIVSKAYPNVTYKFTAPDSSKYYYFQAEDKVGNKTTTTGIKLRKDAEKPIGLFEYKLKKSNGTAYVDADEGTYTDNSGTIVYKAGTVTGLELDFFNLSDEVSGIEGYYLKEGTSEPAALTLDNKKKTIALATIDNESKTYVVSVKDNAGNERTLQTITITSDGTKPDFNLVTSDIVSTDEGGVVYQTGTTPYYINGTNAIISFTKKDADTDIKRYEWKKAADTEWKEMKTDTDASTVLTENGNSIKFQFRAPTDVTAYNFRAVDNVGNASEEASVTIVKDVDSPTGTITGINMNDQNGAAFTDATYYIATTPEGTTTTNILFNSNKIKSVTFIDSGSDNDGGSGYDTTTLWYKVGDENDAHSMENKTLILASSLAETAYHIIAKDKVGNDKEIWTYIFSADGTAEIEDSKISKEKYSDRDVKEINNYTSSVGTIPWSQWKSIAYGRSKANYFASGTQINYEKSALPTDLVQYKLVKTVTTGDSKDTDGFTVTDTEKAGSNWETLSDGTADNSGSYFNFALPDIITKYTRLAFFFKDKVGNESGPYFLGNNESGQAGIQWWITSSPLTANDITIISVTYNGGNGIGWNGSQDYTVKVRIPVGKIIHSVYLAPKPTTEANTGAVLSDTLKLFKFSGYDSGPNEVKETYNAKGYIVLPTSDESIYGELEIGIYPHSNITESTSVLIKFNGASADDANCISKQIFAESNTSFNIASHGGTPGIGTGASAGSRVTQFFNNVANVFVRDSDVTVDNSNAEKVTETAKKAAKKAKKSAKKAGSKAAKKTTAKTPAVEKPVMNVETAEIVEQTVTVTVPEITSVTESVVNELTEVTEKVRGESEIITTIEAAEQSEETSRKPSKSASIVIMLAILSSLGAVWYFQRSRKN